MLDQTQQQALRQRYQALQAGDEIVIAYTPGAGTTMTVNGQSLLQAEAPDLVKASASGSVEAGAGGLM